MEPLSKYSPVTLHLSPATRILSENPERAVLLCQFASNLLLPLIYTSCTVDALFTKEWLLYVYPFGTCTVCVESEVHMDSYTHQVSKKQHHLHVVTNRKHNLAIKKNTLHSYNVNGVQSFNFREFASLPKALSANL